MPDTKAFSPAEKVKRDQHHSVVLIAHYTPWLIKFRAPFLRALKATGAKVTVLSPSDNRDVRLELLNMGIDHFVYSLDRTGFNPLKDARTTLELWRVLRILRPTHVITTAAKPSTFGVLAASRAGVRCIYPLITGLGYAFTGKSLKQRILSAVLSKLYKLAFHRARRVVFQNPDDRAFMTSRGIVPAAKTVVVNGDGVDLQHFLCVPLPPGPVVFVMIARIIKEKGVLEYVEAARRLQARRGTEFRALLVGPFDENPTAIRPSELHDSLHNSPVEYLGEVEDVRSVLANAHVFVLPSYREGLPRTNTEALATGRAIITTDVPGCRQTVVNYQNGLLVPSKSAEALADAMQVFLDDPSLCEKMGAVSRTLAETKFSVATVNREMLGLMGLVQ